MSEELENKKAKVVKPKRVTKKATTKKNIKTSDVENINAVYKYEAKEGEELVMDKPSVPVEKQEVKKQKIEMKPSAPVKTNGQIYDAYIKELKEFKLVYNGDIIYDSTLSKVNTNLKFEADYFVLFGKKYSYNGLRVQKI